MPSKNTKFYSLILIIVDTLILLAAFGLAYVIRVQYDPRPLVSVIYAQQYFISSLSIVPFWILIFASFGLYSPSTYNRRLIEWSKIAIGSFIGILLVIGYEYVTGQRVFPARLVTVYAFVGTFTLVVLGREAMRLVRTLMFRYGKGTSRVLLIGSSNATTDIARSLAETSKSGYHIVAIAGPKEIVPPELNVRRYSLVESALKDIDINKITTIIQTDLYDSSERNQKILGAAQSRHIAYSFIPGEAEFYSGKNTVDIFLGYPMISVSQTPLVGWGAILKRVFDFILSGVLIIILSPIFLIVTILQKIFNPGPTFYISKRLSRFSEPIDLIKFRSMKDRPTAHLDAAEEFRYMGLEELAVEYEKNRKVEKDPRISKFGNFLRITSIDELPQLFNVFKGDLSLVGPRPILPQESKLARGRTALLHSVKSGVTGLWQVSGRSNLNFDERIELELFYAQNWSFWLDIKILFKTVGVVLFKKGAK